MKRRLLGLAMAVGLVGCGAPAASPPPCPTQAPTAAEAQQILTDAASAVVKTNKGEFTIELNGDAAPIATAAEALSSSVVTLLLASAVGASFTELMVTLTTCSVMPPFPSSIRMVKLSDPFSSGSGV